MCYSDEEISNKILLKLNLCPDIWLKVPYRTHKGITTYSLVHSLITESCVSNAALKLGYNTRLIEQVIKEHLTPLYPGRSREFGGGGGIVPWRNALLSTVGFKYCNACNNFKSMSEFPVNNSKLSGKSSECTGCRKVIRLESKKKISIRTPVWANLNKIKEIYAKCPEQYHIDHIIPLNGDSVSGLHVYNNLQCISAKENLFKSNKFDIEKFNEETFQYHSDYLRQTQQNS